MPPALVDVGISSSYDFFFEVAWPNHQEVTRRPSPRSAINAAWPYWHLHEWYFWEHNPSASEKDRRLYIDNILLRDCPELGWLRDIAEAGKHVRLNRTNPPVRVRGISTREEYSGAIGCAPIGVTPIGSGGRLELVVDVGGVTHKLQHVLGAAFRYWLGKVLPHHVEISLPDDRSESMLDWCRAHLGDESAREWLWAYFGNNPPSYSRRLIFLEENTADAFRRQFNL
jgi:hypothetical protein